MVWSWVRRRVGGLGVGVGAWLLAPYAGAAHTPFRLEYKAPPECPGEQAIRKGVAGRIGLDPFVETESNTISVEVTRRKGTGYHAKITIVESGKTRAREIQSVDSRCTEIAADLVFVLRMAVELFSSEYRPGQTHPRRSNPNPHPLDRQLLLLRLPYRLQRRLPARPLLPLQNRVNGVHQPPAPPP
jgi:hypothetical protein